MSKLIGKVALRNAYRVLEDSEGNYKVTHKDARGAEYSQNIAAKVVKYVRKQLRGKTIAVTDAMSLLEDAPSRLELPYQRPSRISVFACVGGALAGGRPGSARAASNETSDGWR